MEKKIIADRFLRWILLIATVKFILFTAGLEAVNRFNGDMIENLYWGQEWQWGYYKHPPLFAWISEAWLWLFNNNMKSYHLLVAIIFSLPVYLNYLFYRKFLDEKTAFVAIILCEGIVYINFVNICINANTLLYIFHPLICLFCYKTCHEKNNTLNWILFGLFCGLAMLTKYSSGLVILACIIYILSIKKLSFIKEKGFYLGFLTSLIIFYPNAYWVIKNDFLPLKYIGDMSYTDALEKGFLYKRWLYTTRLLQGMVLQCLPFLASFAILINHKNIINKSIIAKNLIIPFVTILPFIILTLIFGFGVKDVWMISNVFVLPVIFFTLFDTILSKIRVVIAGFMILIYFISISLVIVILHLFNPNLTERIYSIKVKDHVKAYQDLGYFINQKWQENYKEPPQYICGMSHVDGNISAFSRKFNRLHVIPHCNLFYSKWINLDKLNEKGLIVVLKNKPEFDKLIPMQEIAKDNNALVYQAFKKPDFEFYTKVSDESDETVYVGFYKNEKV